LIRFFDIGTTFWELYNGDYEILLDDLEEIKTIISYDSSFELKDLI